MLYASHVCHNATTLPWPHGSPDPSIFSESVPEKSEKKVAKQIFEGEGCFELAIWLCEHDSKNKGYPEEAAPYTDEWTFENYYLHTEIFCFFLKDLNNQ